MVTIQNRELEALEARIRETEERLRRQQAQGALTGDNGADYDSGRQDTAEKSHNPEKTHNPQISSSSSGSHPSDLGSTGSAPSEGGAYRDASQGQKEKAPRF